MSPVDSASRKHPYNMQQYYGEKISLNSKRVKFVHENEVDDMQKADTFWQKKTNANKYL